MDETLRRQTYVKALRGETSPAEPTKASLIGALRDPQFYKDMAGNVPDVMKGLGAQTLGAPTDIASMLMRPMGYNVPPEQTVGSTEWIGNKLGADTKGLPFQISSMLPTDASDIAKYAVVAPAIARGLNTAKKLPVDELFNAAVKNTPGASITPDGLLMRVQRSQAPEQVGMPSLRGGVFYLPEGAAQAKHYSTGKSGYGGSEKIAGETLFSNPLFVKGATGGKAPEGAFDQLGGKGAYQAMRTEALKVFGGYNSTPQQKAAFADEFLDKYAPELSGMGAEIVRNSSKGNQLPYALQEAAVASAVRRAGHDAVLGYSTSTKTRQPFISEVFDVRERSYPDKFGSPADVWESFEK